MLTQESIEPSRRPDYPSALPRRQRIALVGHAVAGIETHFQNVCQVAGTFPGLEPVIVPVNPYRAGDILERRFGFLSEATRGTLRSLFATACLFRLRNFDGVWTQVDMPLLPWLVTRNPFRRVPTLYSLDSTPRLLEEFGQHYEIAVSRSVMLRFLRDLCFRYFLRRVTRVSAWTHWAAISLERHYGVQGSRIDVVPPGVDVSFWQPPDHSEARRSPAKGRPARLLFVGGDFIRKGGDLLLDVYRQHFRGRAELDVVTRPGRCEPVEGVTVHSGLRPNDERLLNLYQRADIFVLPSRADCFSMAALEAMAVGLPIIICPVGGLAELLDSGRQGFLVRPDNGRDLAQAILALVDDRARREAMGQAGRALAVARYDVSINTRRLFEILLSKPEPHPRRWVPDEPA